MFLYTFAVNINKHSINVLTRTLNELLIKSLDKHLKNYKLIVYTNYNITNTNKNVEIRKYYDNSKINMYSDKWLNLCYNRINIYKNLHDEFNKDFTWIDLDTVIARDMSYVNNLDNFFVETGGRDTSPFLIFTNKNISVPRNRYVQGNFWKLNINIYNDLIKTLQVLNNKGLKLKYDIQGLFNYYINVQKKVKNINILGLNIKQNTINGLSIWSKQGNTHVTLGGLNNLYYDDDILKTKFYPGKEIHIVSFTFDTLKMLWNTNIFNNLFMYNKMDIEERFQYYIGDLYNKTAIITKKHENINPKINQINRLCKMNYSLLKQNKLMRTKYPDYTERFLKILEKINHDNKPFLYQIGDIEDEIDEYCIAKNRTSYKNKSVVLKCIEQNRHWDGIDVSSADIPYNKKKDMAIWRGATTGRTTNPANRFMLVEKFFNKNPNIKVGFTIICQGKNKYKKYLKKSLTKKQLLMCKFIISVEGNDKASGLNWQLNSNSVVMMAKPTKFSWLMEDKLIPNYHYVLLKDDFSDLESKFEWCKKNPEKCQEISRNATGYMNNFKNKKIEDELQERIVKTYFDKVKFM